MGTKFQDSWLKKLDDNNMSTGKWANKVPNDPFSSYCWICKKQFKSSGGFDKLKQHSSTQKHKKNLSKFCDTQLIFKTNNNATEDISSSNRNTCSESEAGKTTGYIGVAKNNFVELFSIRDVATRAELIWALDSVNCKYSLNSAHGKKELLKYMFPGGVPEGFSISPTKLSYLITEALAPFYKKQLLDEIDDAYVVLEFDETSSESSKKELQTRVQFWSKSTGKVENHFLEAYFIENGKADTIHKYLLQALNSSNISPQKVITLSMDGPPVNKKVFKLFNEHLKKSDSKPLLDVGSCSIHFVHNGFLNGIDELTLDVSDYIVKVFYFFYHKDVRRSKYKAIQEKLEVKQHNFEKHIETRWLTLGPAAEKMMGQMPALEEYFLRYIPLNDKKTMKTKRYLDIKEYLDNPLLIFYLKFASYTAEIFTKNFTKLFQKEKPLIHILYIQLEKLIMILVSNVINSKYLNSLKKNFQKDSLKKILNDATKFRSLLPDEKDKNCEVIDCGEEVQKLLVSFQDTELKLQFLTDCKNFYKSSALYMIDNLSSRQSLKLFQCLSPEKITSSESEKQILKLARLLPIKYLDEDQLKTEWKILSFDQDVAFKLEKNERVDSFWNAILQLKTDSHERYPTLKIIVPVALSVSHGNANVERGFSDAGLYLTKDKTSMGIRMLNSLLTVKDAMKRFNCETHKVPISLQLIRAGQSAHKSYITYLDQLAKIEEDKKKKEEREQKEKILEEAALRDLDKELKTVKNLEEDLEKEKFILKQDKENHSSMAKLLKKESEKKQINTVILQNLIRNVDSLSNKADKQQQKVDNLAKSISTRKTTALESAVLKRKKKMI